jgi:hypothetical protein
VGQRPQEADVVHGEAGPGRGLLGRVPKRGDHRWEAREGSLEPLPMGGQAPAPTVTYQRKL